MFDHKAGSASKNIQTSAEHCSQLLSEAINAINTFKKSRTYKMSGTKNKEMINNIQATIADLKGHCDKAKTLNLESLQNCTNPKTEAHQTIKRIITIFTTLLDTYEKASDDIENAKKWAKDSAPAMDKKIKETMVALKGLTENIDSGLKSLTFSDTKFAGAISFTQKSLKRLIDKQEANASAKASKSA